MGFDSGYSLPLLLGWLQDLCEHEAERPQSLSGPISKRVGKVYDAIQLLSEAADMGGE